MLVTENLVKQYGELKAQLGARDALQLSGEFPEPGVKQALESLMIIWLGTIAQAVILAAATLVAGYLAVRRFEYQ